MPSPALDIGRVHFADVTCLCRLRQEQDVVAYFYCSYNDLSSQEPRSILCSLICQLCRSQPTTQDLIVRAYDEEKSRNGAARPPEVPMLVDLMVRILQTVPANVIILVDGTNECSKTLTVIIGALFQVLTNSTQVKLMLSSTENVASFIQERISENNLTAETVWMDLSKISGDIDRYIIT
jgi:hypothetical protein